MAAQAEQVFHYKARESLHLIGSLSLNCKDEEVTFVIIECSDQAEIYPHHNGFSEDV